MRPAASTKRMKYRGVVCEKCGVEVTHSRKFAVSAWATSSLATPVAHIWFFKLDCRAASVTLLEHHD